MSELPPGWTSQGPVLWAYKVATIGGAPHAIEAQLNQFGADGWELVATSLGGAWQSAQSQGSPVGFAILKRPYVGAIQPR